MKEEINWKNEKDGIVSSEFETTKQQIERDIKELEGWIKSATETLDNLTNPIKLTQDELELRDTLKKIEEYGYDQTFRKKYHDIEKTLKDLADNIETNKKRIEYRMEMIKSWDKKYAKTN